MVLDEPAIAGDQGFKGFIKEGRPGYFMVNFGGRLYNVTTLAVTQQTLARQIKFL